MVAAVGGAALLLAVVAVPGAASAHNSLVSSTPEAGSTLTALPAEFQVTTNEDLLDTGGALGGFALQVVGADGLFYGDGCVRIDGATMASSPALGPAGDYTLAWQVVSIDGHPVDGTVDFAWDPASGEELATGSATAPVCGEGAADAEAGEPEAAPAPSAPAGDSDANAPSPTGQEAASVASMVPLAGGILVLAAVIGGISYALWRRKRP